MRDDQALDAIANAMSGAEWNADTLDLIAEVVRQTGRVIADYPPWPARIVRVTFDGQRASMDGPSEAAELVIVCPTTDRECDAKAWGYEARCLGDARHPAHDIDLPNDEDDDLALETALDEWKENRHG